MFDFRRITLFCLGYRLYKHKMTICSENWEGMIPRSPLATHMVSTGNVLVSPFSASLFHITNFCHYELMLPSKFLHSPLTWALKSASNRAQDLLKPALRMSYLIQHQTKSYDLLWHKLINIILNDILHLQGDWLYADTGTHEIVEPVLTRFLKPSALFHNMMRMRFTPSATSATLLTSDIRELINVNT